MERIKLITFDNAKTIKGEKQNYLTGILYLAPHKIVQGLDLCPKSTPGCRASCLFTAGRGAMSNVKNARIKKTELFRDNQELFFDNLVLDIKAAIKKAAKKNYKLCIRLNGTSDIMWERIKIKNHDDKNIFELFPDVTFYDYSKIFNRYNKNLPSNYSLTFSAAENNLKQAIKILHQGGNVSMVFDNVPETFRGFQVINGDDTDLRFLDKPGTIIGLKAKGQGRKDDSGFVIKGAA